MLTLAAAAGGGHHLFWIASRAAGIVALLLASVSVGVGLLQGTRVAKPGRDLKALHEALSLATIAALVVHGVTLLGDGFMHPNAADLAIPFASSYKTFWTSLGITSGWALIALGLSYYMRDRIGIARWRTLHRFTALAWLGGLVHSLGEGTDSGQGWFLVGIGVAVLPSLSLLVWRTTSPYLLARPRASVR
jgi:sulfoxide reductase heme-binding subunit YedZ